MITVCGPNEPNETEIAIAERVGELIARSGHALICGGRGGVMAAACRGAKRFAGTTIGILPGYDEREANEWVDHAVCTGIGHARNAIVAASGEAVIAIGGGFGTLSEIGLALKLGKPVIAIESWRLDPERISQHKTGAASFVVATTPDDAVTLALGLIREKRVAIATQSSGHG